jgi:hypothetical protein
VGRVSSVLQASSSGAPLSEQKQGFTPKTSVPYTCDTTSTESKTYDPANAAVFKTIRSERLFDMYGTVITSTDAVGKVHHHCL